MKNVFGSIISLLKDEELQTKLPVATAFEGIYLPQHNLLLHFIDLAHPAVTTVATDYFSRLSDQASSQNIRLIHIWSDVYLNNTLLVEARILAHIGKRQRIHARQTAVVRIDKKQADDFLITHHLQQSAGAYYKYGLTNKDTLTAVATFSKSRVMHDGPTLYRSYELVRFASRKGTTVIGGLGKLIAHFIKEHHSVHLMTYADRDWSSGAGYEKLGFRCVDVVPPHTFYIHPEELIRYPASHLPQGVKEEELIGKGYLRIFNSGNLKYVLDRRNQHS